MPRYSVTYFAPAVVYVTIEVEAADAEAAESTPLAKSIGKAAERWPVGPASDAANGPTAAADLRRTADWDVLMVRDVPPR